MAATINLVGMYNFDNDLFHDLTDIAAQDDTGATHLISKELIKSRILFDAAEFEVLYTDYDFFRFAIGEWWKTERKIFEELYRTTLYEYNPIWNKDGTIEENRSHTTQHDSRSSGHNTGRDNVAATDQMNENGETVGQVSAFNATAFQNHDKNTDSRNRSVANTEIHDSEADNNSETHYATAEGENVTKREYGNIGVVSTQALIKEQRDVVKFNILSAISDSFRNRFCLLIY